MNTGTSTHPEHFLDRTIRVVRAKDRDTRRCSHGTTPDDRGRRILDDSFYMMFNAHHEARDFTLPPRRWGEQWQLVMDTERGFAHRRDAATLRAGEKFRAMPRLLAIWQRSSK
ncbi:MAG TPA: hypothetical protein VMF89_12740 [Polyangiales bacterium]|nr:hypothetical protein [Polyangiales bacterium]